MCGSLIPRDFVLFIPYLIVPISAIADIELLIPARSWGFLHQLEVGIAHKGQLRAIERELW